MSLFSSSLGLSGVATTLPALGPVDPANSTTLLLMALVSIVGLIVLVARFKVNAFIGLLLASVFLGITTGMPLTGIVSAFEEGLGKTLGQLGMVIALGTILGKLLSESGGAEVIATRMVHLFGVKRLDYAVMLMAFLIGISVFFGVGFVLLGPIAFTLARETRTPILRLALPMAAGLSTAHGLIPPHPGPMAAIGILHASVGKTILWSLLFGLPTALITGPFLARWVSPLVPVEIGGLGAPAAAGGTAPRRPSFASTIFTLLLPVILMLIGTLADITLPKDEAPSPAPTGAAITPASATAAAIASPADLTLTPAATAAPEDSLRPLKVKIRTIADFLAAPTVALLVAVLVASWTLGRFCGLTSGQILKFSEECLGPAALLFVVIGAGGGFSTVLKYSGVSNAVAAMAAGSGLSPLFLGWTIAGLLRIAVGSATVAVTVSAGLMAEIIKDPAMHTSPELLVLAMGSGSLILSHVNDSGFWFVKEYLGMSVGQTLRTWTVVETGIAVTSLLLILLASIFIS